jgi:hypothetical protein
MQKFERYAGTSVGFSFVIALLAFIVITADVNAGIFCNSATKQDCDCTDCGLPATGFSQSNFDADAYIEKLRKRNDEALERMRKRSDERTQSLFDAPKLFDNNVAQPPAIAYWNAATQQMFVGGRAFHKDDHVAAKETWGKYNTKKPEGPGWVGLPESSYTSYMAGVNGHKTIAQTGSEAIYRNCVIEKSVNQPESVVREIRAACRAISNDPSIYEKWKWGE